MARAVVDNAIRKAERHLETADPIMKRLIATHGHCPLAERELEILGRARERPDDGDVGATHALRRWRYLTAIGNDYSYAEVFEKQVQALGKRGDVLMVISTSGNAANGVRAVEVARKMGILTVALTGGTGGKLAPLCDRVISISCTNATPRIQEGHLIVMHTLCQLVEEKMESQT